MGDREGASYGKSNQEGVGVLCLVCSGQIIRGWQDSNPDNTCTQFCDLFRIFFWVGCSVAK
jgi:hypothetical protein